MDTTNTITLHATVKRLDNLDAQTLDQDLVMANIEAGKYYGMALTSRRIYEIIEQPCTVADVIAHLLAEYDVERSTCERETLAFLDELKREGLIEVV
jgi:Coenzyme PQQ synthesis protein D (PqqD)